MHQPAVIRPAALKTALEFCLSLALAFGCAWAASAEVVYVTVRPQPSGSGPNPDGTYAEVNLTLNDSAAKGSGAGRPSVSGSRSYTSSISLNDTNAGFNVTPRLSYLCDVYQIDHNFSALAGNVSTDVVLSVTCTGGTLSFTNTDAFQAKYGNPDNLWHRLGYLTNRSTSPTLAFRYQSGTVSAAAQCRLVVDCFRFTSYPACLAIPATSVNGPLYAGQTQVQVDGVVSNATAVSVYQSPGDSIALIGSKTTGLVPGINLIEVTPLLQGQRVFSTQIISECGEESCPSADWPLVGPPAALSPLSIDRQGPAIFLNWTGSCQLQAAASLTGPWQNLPGVTNAPFLTNADFGALFFRLIGPSP